MTGKSIFKNPALIGYLVKRIKVEFPGRQVGKTIIQKMMYLLNRNEIVDFNYSMYHYGPYSSELSGELNFAQNAGIVQIKWVDDKGYFIETTSKLQNFEKLMTEREKQALDDLVERFGSYNAIELSIIATAYYVKDTFDVPETKLVSVIHQIKQNHSVEYIENILRKVGILKQA